MKILPSFCPLRIVKTASRMLLIFLCLGLSLAAQAQLKIYPALSAMQGCQFAYTLKARVSGTTTWNTVPLYNVVVTNQSGGSSNSTVANFDCNGPIDVQITFSAAVTSAGVYPNSLNITPAISGSEITFTIPGPEKFYVDINGDHYNNCMHIIANPIEVNPPHQGDPNVIFIPTGTFDNTVKTLTSGQTLYIEGGAAVNGVVLNNTTNTKVLGRGFIYRPSYDALSVSSASNVTIEGIIGLNHGWAGGGGDGFRCGQSTNVSISNTAAFSSKKWGDGYNIFSSNGVTVDHVFIRTNDDAITFYGGGKSGFTGDCKNITVTNSVLLPDLAQPIHVGVYGDQYDTEIRDITVSNVDICDWSRTPGRPVIYFTVGDKVRAANFHFNDVRTNGYMPASFGKSFIGMAIVYNGTYNYTVGRAIDSVYFNNCSYNGTNGLPGSAINGYDGTRKTTNVFFNNLKMNGTTITSASQGNFGVGSFASNVVFSTIPLSPVADSYVNGAATTTNYGTSNYVVSKTSATNRYAYLKFDLRGLPDTIASAKLRLYVKSVTAADSRTVYALSDDTWDEATLTWANRPSYGAALASAYVPGSNRYIEWDVTSYIRAEYAGDGFASICVNDPVANHNTGIDFYTKENISNIPQLVFTTIPSSARIAAMEVEEHISNGLIIYPNPASDVLKISLPDSYPNGAKVEVYNILGELVSVKNITGNSGTMDIGGFSPGIYVVKIDDGRKVKVGRIVKR